MYCSMRLQIYQKKTVTTSTCIWWNYVVFCSRENCSLTDELKILLFSCLSINILDNGAASVSATAAAVYYYYYYWSLSCRRCRRRHRLFQLTSPLLYSHLLSPFFCLFPRDVISGCDVVFCNFFFIFPFDRSEGFFFFLLFFSSSAPFCAEFKRREQKTARRKRREKIKK